MSRYLRQEDNGKLLLEDGTGALLLDPPEDKEFWGGQLLLEHGRVYRDSWQMGERPNPSTLRW